MLGSSLVENGLNAWQAVITVFLGNCIVLLPLILNGIPGARFGITFPVFIRASFGVRGAKITALARAVVGIGWFSLQAWIGGLALFEALAAFWPGARTFGLLGNGFFANTNALQLTFFALFLLVHVFLIRCGMRSISHLQRLTVPILAVSCVALFTFCMASAGFKSSYDALNDDSESGQPPRKTFNAAFWPSLTAVIAGYSTLALNILVKSVFFIFFSWHCLPERVVRANKRPENREE